jgi:histidinol-phosphate aminotransferase
MAPEGTLPPADAFLDRPNVIRMRTFSKAYGLAGMRCGYAFGHADTIVSFDKVRNHFGMNILAQVAALAALQDQAYLEQVCGRIATSRERIGSIARANGLAPLPSATNFVALDCGRDGAFATAVLQQLVNRGVFVRMPGVAPQNRCIRISAAPDSEIDIFEEALPDALAAASSQTVDSLS